MFYYLKHRRNKRNKKPPIRQKESSDNIIKKLQIKNNTIFREKNKRK